MRIATLLPSATEIVYALGLWDNLVAVSHDCDYPPAVKEKIVLTSVDFNTNQSSHLIEQAVKERVHRGTSIYHIDSKLLKAANPDIILTQELCEVCAPAFSDVKRSAKILDSEPKIISLEPNTLKDILANIITVGDVTNASDKANQLVSRLGARIEEIAEKTKEVRNRPKVFCMEWLDPVYTAGHWVPEMVRIAGGVDELATEGKPSEPIEWQKVVDYNPELIVVMPCGFRVERILSETHRMRINSLPGWRELEAARSNRVFAVDASQYFNRPGPRIVGGLEILAEILHPEIFGKIAPRESYVRLET